MAASHASRFGQNASHGGIGVAINTETINKIEPNLASALLKIYTEQK